MPDYCETIGCSYLARWSDGNPFCSAPSGYICNSDNEEEA